MTSAGTGDTAFTGRVPELYEQVLVPMIFAEPARLLAATVAGHAPSDVLETAAGTGALTRELEHTGAANIVATDLNAAMVEQTNAASQTLAQDAETLTRLVDQFQIGAGAKPVAVAPKAATAASRPSPSPAKSLLNRVAGAFTTNAAVKGNALPAADNWEEF